MQSNLEVYEEITALWLFILTNLQFKKKKIKKERKKFQNQCPHPYDGASSMYCTCTGLLWLNK